MASEQDKRDRRSWRAIMAVLMAGVVVGAAIWVFWVPIAVAVAPGKLAASSRSQQSLDADDLFWQTFHAGNYQGIQPALEAVTAAYLKTPRDAITASHVAWLHIWRVSERERLTTVPATITDDVLLARRYFEESVRLNPHDPRTLGFLASGMMSEGQIMGDARLIRRGYFAMHDAIKAWPAFNLFTAGYVMSDLPVDSTQFHEALDDQWRNLDACAGTHVNRTHPNFGAHMNRILDHKACLNTDIAPHNIEGFFLNMGDMLVKSGNWQLAQEIYGYARLSPQFGSWKFASTLEDRVRNARDNVDAFSASKHDARGSLMVDSAFSCMACHQH